jgi:hypothetical protein
MKQHHQKLGYLWNPYQMENKEENPSVQTKYTKKQLCMQGITGDGNLIIPPPAVQSWDGVQTKT